MSVETQGRQTFARMARDFFWDIPRAPEEFEKKFVLNFCPIYVSAELAITIGAKIITHKTLIVGELISQLHTSATQLQWLRH